MTFIRKWIDFGILERLGKYVNDQSPLFVRAHCLKKGILQLVTYSSADKKRATDGFCTTVALLANVPGGVIRLTQALFQDPHFVWRQLQPLTELLSREQIFGFIELL